MTHSVGAGMSAIVPLSEGKPPWLPTITRDDRWRDCARTGPLDAVRPPLRPVSGEQLGLACEAGLGQLVAHRGSCHR